MSLQSIIDDLDALDVRLDREAEHNSQHYFALRDALKALRFSRQIVQRVEDLDCDPPDTDGSDWRERAAAMKPELV